jgi:hypothetical protein
VVWNKAECVPRPLRALTPMVIISALVVTPAPCTPLH